MNLVGSLVSGAVVATVLWQAGSLRGGNAGLTLSYATQFVQAVMQTNPKPNPNPNPNPKPNPKPNQARRRALRRPRQQHGAERPPR